MVDVDAETRITGIAALRDAGPTDMAFYANPRYAKDFEASSAGLILVDASNRIAAKPQLLVEDAYGGFCDVLEWLTPAPPVVRNVPASSTVASSASIDASATIAANVTIGENCSVGANSVLMPGVVLEDGVAIGTDCTLFSNVVVRYGCHIGNRVRLQPGVVVGGDGFGYVLTRQGLRKVPQRGAVRIEDDVEIGANSTVDRGTIGDTIIRQGAKIDNLVMIAHNVEIGPYAIVVAQAGISGSTKIGAGVQIGGQAGITGHITIGDGAQIGAQSGVAENLAPGSRVLGSPSLPANEYLRAHSLFRKLPQIWKSVRGRDTRN